uniref:L-serine deaminase n=1 Tax=Pristionchus pacificus TaxID=54126 RepID=A0A2A6C7P2_PRIPA|eukprot:PDM74179.1 hypothetical protein PRIPAC_41535 [Pristionchus pacificus]
MVRHLLNASTLLRSISRLPPHHATTRTLLTKNTDSVSKGHLYAQAMYPEPTEARLDVHCDPSNPRTLSFDRVKEAAIAIKKADPHKFEGGVMHTELRHSFLISNRAEKDVHLKMELNQITGSFKERGGRFALHNLTDEQKKAGVFAASAGNHALALCWHGKQMGVPITVCMPRYINGYDHVDVLAGAGTIGIEILEQLDNVDAIVVPVGGGGLIAGIAVAVKALKPSVEIIGVESTLTASMKNALEQGAPVPTKISPTLADGLAVSVVGVNSFHNAKGKIDRMITVEEADIAVAVLRLIELEKVVPEGSGACGVAAILSGQLDDLKGRRVATIVSGGNIDSTALNRCIERGMAHDHRLIRFSVVVSDRCGAINELSQFIADLGVSIKDMDTDRPYQRHDIFSVRVNIIAETRGFEHAEKLNKALLKRYGQVDAVFKHMPYMAK